VTLGITYDDTEALGRVRLAFSGYSTDADYALVERSTDQINWYTVRGGDRAGLSGGAGALDDYEFKAGVVNYYRVSAVNEEAMSPLAPGTLASGNNVTPLVPGLPAGAKLGDVLILQAAIRNSGTGTVTLPSGWTAITNTGNMLLAYKDWVSGVTAPSVAFVGGAAGEDTLASVYGLRNASMQLWAVATPLLNPAATAILTPAIAVPAKGYQIRYGWTQDDYSGSSLSTFSVLTSAISTAGNDAGIISVGKLHTTAVNDIAQVITLTGGTSVISRGGSVSFQQRAWLNQDTGNITPTVTRFRIKNPSRPAVNTVVEPMDITEVTRPSRTGVFDVQGRTLPVTVSDVQGSRQFTLTLDVYGYAARDDLDAKLSSGEPLFLQTPAGDQSIPTLYFVAGDYSYKEDAKMTGSFTFTIPVKECAAPGSTVYGDTYIYADVLADFATYGDVLAGATSYSNLLDKVSDNSIIVP
jgi:hypothetical protein